MSKLSEFDLIAKYFVPLTKGEPLESGNSFGLTDDAAILSCGADEDWVVTKDAIVAGVHFLSDDPPEAIAKKLLRVNLSDLAAKGAKPAHYVVAAAWPHEIDEDWVARFANGLAEDQETFGVYLLGGDTVSTPGPATFSLTAFGTVPKGQMIKRAGAKVGDRLFVSGTIGDSYLGLKVLRRELSGLADGDLAFLRSRYHLPQPRTNLRNTLRAHATAAIDVSDGLLADAGHLAAASGVGHRIDLENTPLSAPARASISLGLVDAEALLTGGDDYEVLFTAPAGTAIPDTVTEIGEVIAEKGLWANAEGGALKPLTPSGFTHF